MPHGAAATPALLSALMTVNSTLSSEASVSFGFRDVPEGARQGLVNSVFATVAERYDVMNDLMSGGLHRLWKRDFVSWLNPPPGKAVRKRKAQIRPARFQPHDPAA